MELSTKQLKQIASKFKKYANMPILETIKIENSSLTLTDLETTIVINNFLDYDYEGCINGMDFIKVVENIPDFCIELNRERVTFYNAKEKITLPCVDINDFPLMPKNYVPDGQLTANDLNNILIARTFTAIDELKPAFETVYLNHDIVATNGWKLFKRQTEGQINNVYLLQDKTIELLSIFKPENFNIAYHNENNEQTYFKISFDNIDIYQRSLCAKYPQYNSVIPDQKNLLNSLTVGQSIKKDIEKAATFCNPIEKRIKIFTEDEKVFIGVENPDKDIKYQKEIEGKHTNFQEALFNPDVLLSTIRSIEGNITIRQGNILKAHLINNDYLVMPCHP